MDQLASEGIRFTDFHVAASVCTVSRAALMTGRLGVRTGVVHNFGIDSVAGLPRTENTISELLKPAGYRTAGVCSLPPPHTFFLCRALRCRERTLLC